MESRLNICYSILIQSGEKSDGGKGTHCKGKKDWFKALKSEKSALKYEFTWTEWEIDVKQFGHAMCVCARGFMNKHFCVGQKGVKYSFLNLRTQKEKVFGVVDDDRPGK